MDAFDSDTFAIISPKFNWKNNSIHFLFKIELTSFLSLNQFSLAKDVYDK